MEQRLWFIPDIRRLGFIGDHGNVINGTNLLPPSILQITRRGFDRISTEVYRPGTTRSDQHFDGPATSITLHRVYTQCYALNVSPRWWPGTSTRASDGSAYTIAFTSGGVPDQPLLA